jgi:hypothetical protein
MVYTVQLAAFLIIVIYISLFSIDTRYLNPRNYLFGTLFAFINIIDLINIGIHYG